MGEAKEAVGEQRRGRNLLRVTGQFCTTLHLIEK
jgi:hypothetical protein